LEGTDVLVTYGNDTLSGVTDNTGFAYFTLDIGFYLISVTAQGYYKTDGDFNVVDISNTYLEVTLPVQGNTINLI
jgi:hypothetical protein